MAQREVIICTRCGYHNSAGREFCRSCAAFLEWSGHRVEPAGPEEVPEESSPCPAVPKGRWRAAWEAWRNPSASVELGQLDASQAEPSIPAEGSTSVAPSRTAGSEAAAPLALAGPLSSPGAPKGVLAAGVSGGGSPGSSTSADGVLQSSERTGLVHSPGPSGSNEALGAGSPAPGSFASGRVSQAGTAVQDSTTQQLPATHGTPGPVRPVVTGRARPVDSRPGAVESPLHDGDIICGQCGTGNVPIRYFCRRCAASLIDAVPYRLTRWQAFRQRRSERRQARRRLRAGQRPKVHRLLVGGEGGGLLAHILVRVVVVALLLTALFTAVGPFAPTLRSTFHGWIDDIGGAIHPTYNPVHPIAATATSFAPGHPPTNAIDGLTTTYWATAPSATSGVGQVLTVRFSGPVNIDRVGFLLGATGSAGAYLSEARPSVVHLVFSNGASANLTLTDSSAFQAYEVRADHVTQMQLTVEAVYASPIGHECAIAQIEFFTLVR